MNSNCVSNLTYFCAQAILKTGFKKQPCCTRKTAFQNDLVIRDSRRPQITHTKIKLSQILRSFQISGHFRTVDISQRYPVKHIIALSMSKIFRLVLVVKSFSTLKAVHHDQKFQPQIHPNNAYICWRILNINEGYC